MGLPPVPDEYWAGVEVNAVDGVVADEQPPTVVRPERDGVVGFVIAVHRDCTATPTARELGRLVQFHLPVTGTAGFRDHVSAPFPFEHVRKREVIVRRQNDPIVLPVDPCRARRVTDDGVRAPVGVDDFEEHVPPVGTGKEERVGDEIDGAVIRHVLGDQYRLVVRLGYPFEIDWAGHSGPEATRATGGRANPRQLSVAPVRNPIEEPRDPMINDFAGPPRRPDGEVPLFDRGGKRGHENTGVSTCKVNSRRNSVWNTLKPVRGSDPRDGSARTTPRMPRWGRRRQPPGGTCRSACRPPGTSPVSVRAPGSLGR